MTDAIDASRTDVGISDAGAGIDRVGRCPFASETLLGLRCSCDLSRWPARQFTHTER